MMETNSDCWQRSAKRRQASGASEETKRSLPSDRIEDSPAASVLCAEDTARAKRPRVDGSAPSEKASDDSSEGSRSSLADMASQVVQQHGAPIRPSGAYSMLNTLQYSNAGISNAAINDAASRAFLGIQAQAQQRNALSELLTSTNMSTQPWGLRPAASPSALNVRSLFGVQNNNVSSGGFPFDPYQPQSDLVAQHFLQLQQARLGTSQNLMNDPAFLCQLQGLQQQPAASSDIFGRLASPQAYDQRSPFNVGRVSVASALSQQQMAQLNVLRQQSMAVQQFNLGGMSSLHGLLGQTNPTFGIGGTHLPSDFGNSLLPFSPPDTYAASLPTVIARQEDSSKLSSHQVLLRHQIEVFQASDDDVQTHIRGRNKPITLGQVGIRCRHCAHLPVSRRQKGSTYFPASVVGLYQAAQNMNTTHMQCGLCTEMPEDVKQQFAEFVSMKTPSSGAGRPYWAQSAKKMGLVDAGDSGIRFIRSMPLMHAGGSATI